MAEQVCRLLFADRTIIVPSWMALGKMPFFQEMENKMAGKSQKALSFESALAELEQVVADMEAGKLSLEDSLAAYQRGAELLQYCRGRLDDAQHQVRLLEEGTLKNFIPSGVSDAAKRDDG